MTPRSANVLSDDISIPGGGGGEGDREAELEAEPEADPEADPDPEASEAAGEAERSDILRDSSGGVGRQRGWWQGSTFENSPSDLILRHVILIMNVTDFTFALKGAVKLVPSINKAHVEQVDSHPLSLLYTHSHSVTQLYDLAIPCPTHHCLHQSLHRTCHRALFHPSRSLKQPPDNFWPWPSLVVPHLRRRGKQHLPPPPLLAMQTFPSLKNTSSSPTLARVALE